MFTKSKPRLLALEPLTTFKISIGQNLLNKKIPFQMLVPPQEGSEQIGKTIGIGKFEL